jgi:hypothetical protein
MVPIARHQTREAVLRLWILRRDSALAIYTRPVLERAGTSRVDFSDI